MDGSHLVVRLEAFHEIGETHQLFTGVGDTHEVKCQRELPGSLAGFAIGHDAVELAAAWILVEEVLESRAVERMLGLHVLESWYRSVLRCLIDGGATLTADADAVPPRHIAILVHQDALPGVPTERIAGPVSPGRSTVFVRVAEVELLTLDT